MKLNYILIFWICLTISCAKKDDNDQNDNNNQSNGGLISRIENDAPPSYDQGDNFYYENDKLQFLDVDNCSGLKYYFVYGNNGKVSKVYPFQDSNFDISHVDIQQITSNNTPVDYIYENGTLNRFEINGNPYKYFSYYKDGKLKEFEYPNNSKYIFEYTNNKVSKITSISLYSGNIVIYTFDFDDKINPIYKVFNQFGIFDVEICRSLEEMMMFRHLPVFTNNIERVYRDNELIMSATYQYFESNYPERVITNEEDGDQFSEFFTYE